MVVVSAPPLPPPAPAVTPLGVDVTAATVTHAVRAASIVLVDVVAQVRGAGSLTGGSGAADDAARAEAERFARAVDVAAIALESATRGLESFEDHVADLGRRHAALQADSASYDAALRELRSRLHGEPAPERLVAEIESLGRWREGLVSDGGQIASDLASAEDRLIAILRGLDTDAEATATADALSPGARPDAERIADLLRRLRALADDPERVHAWWVALSGRERDALVTHHPEVVGNTDGIPVSARDDANRAALAVDLAALAAGVVAGARGPWRATVTAVRDALARASRSGAEVYLVEYRPDAFDGDGSGAIAIGDPEQADHVAVTVPGLTSDLAGIDGQIASALDLYEAIEDRNAGTTSVIAWMGYDAPTFDPPGVRDLLDEGADVLGVAGDDAAEDGGHALVDFVDGLHATDVGPAAEVTVVGHSYGSTTVAHAAADGLQADAVVLLGSPGAGVDTVDDLGFGGDVYVGAADRDPVSWLGSPGEPGLGQDPAQDSFGAIRFDVDPGEPFHVQEFVSVGFEQNHSSYDDPGSHALANTAAVVAGADPDVVPGRDDPAPTYLGAWLDDERDHWVDELVDQGHAAAGDLLGTLEDLGIGG